MKILIALTGGSGVIYAKRLIDVLTEKLETPPDLIISDVANGILKDELSLDSSYFVEKGCRIFSNKDFYTPPASGSASYDSMVIVPASACTIGKISSGVCDNLVTRAADVFLKERRNLVIVPRETPLNIIHLENLLTLTKAGATILPASPGFYHNPKEIGDLVDFIVDRILSHLKLDIRLMNSWGEKGD